MALYMIFNGPFAATAFAGVTTGTALKTLLQVKLGALNNRRAKVVEWGCSFKGFAAAEPGRVELLCTSTVAATVTAHAVANITNLQDPNPAVAITDDNPFDLSTTATGYTASAEGTVTAARYLAPPQFIAPTTQYQFQLPLAQEGEFSAAEYLRIRAHFPAAVDCMCYVKIEA